jgi:hypothetical protein
VPEQLSDSGIEERIIASTTRRLLRYDYEGHPLILIVLDDDTFAFDARTRQFHNPRSYGLDRFRAASAINVGTDAYLGDETTNQVWTFDGWADDDGPLERLFTAYFPLDKGSVAVDNLWIEANFGRTDLLERARLRSSGGNALFAATRRDVERLGSGAWRAGPISQHSRMAGAGLVRCAGRDV